MPYKYNPLSNKGLDYYGSGSVGNTITVAKSGGDFNSVEDALQSILDNSATNRYCINLAPGIYTIDNSSGPISLKDYVGLTAYSIRSVTFQPQDPTQDMFTAAEFAYIEGIVFTGNTTGWILNHTQNARININDCVLRDCGNGFLLNSSNGALEIRRLAINSPNNTTTTYGIRQLTGNLVIYDFVVRFTARVTSLIDISGSGSQSAIINLACISPYITTALRIYDGALVSGSSLNIILPYDGIVVYGDNTVVRLDGSKVYNAQRDGLRIENTGTGIDFSLFSGIISKCSRYNFNIQNSDALVTGTGFTELDNSYLEPGCGFYAGIIDISEDDEGFNIFGELHVGRPGSGAESVLGEGDSYTQGMLVYTETSGNVFTDVSDEAKSASGSTFTFPGVEVNNAIYIASSLSNTTDVLGHHGIKTKIDTAAVKGTGAIIAEYWDGASWTEVNGMEVQSISPYLPHANDYFSNTGSHQIRYDSSLATDSWTKNDPMSLGVDYYWIRFRISSEITTAPIFEQIKLHSNRSEINADGWCEYFGNARPLGQLPINFSAARPFEGNMQSEEIYVNEDVASGFTQNKFTAEADKTGVAGFLPFDCDTSSPLIVQWSGRSSNTETIEWTIRLHWVTDNGSDLYYTTEPSLLPGRRVVTTSKSVTSGEVSMFEASLDIKEMVSKRASDFGDELWISIQPSTMTGTFTLTSSQIIYTKWCEGGHI